MGKIRGSKVFSKVDLVKAYHQIPLDGPSQDKTVVLTPWGTYKFKRLPMGLRNSAQSFQKLIALKLIWIHFIRKNRFEKLMVQKVKWIHLKVMTCTKYLKSKSRCGVSSSGKRSWLDGDYKVASNQAIVHTTLLKCSMYSHCY